MEDCHPPAGLKATSYTITNLTENQEYKIDLRHEFWRHWRTCTCSWNSKAEDRMLPPEIELDAELRKVVTIRACCTLETFCPHQRKASTRGEVDLRTRRNLLDVPVSESTSSYTLLIIGNVNRFDSGGPRHTDHRKQLRQQVCVCQCQSPRHQARHRDLKVKEVTKSSVTLTWERLLTGGSKINNYIVEKRESTRKAYSTVTTNCHKTSWR